MNVLTEVWLVAAADGGEAVDKAVDGGGGVSPLGVAGDTVSGPPPLLEADCATMQEGRAY